MHIPVVILATGAVVCICTIPSPFTWIRCCLDTGVIDFFFTVACFCIKQVSIKTLVYLPMAMRTPVTQYTAVHWSVFQPCTTLDCYWHLVFFSKQERLCSRWSDSDRERKQSCSIYRVCRRMLCWSCFVYMF